MSEHFVRSPYVIEEQWLQLKRLDAPLEVVHPDGTAECGSLFATAAEVRASFARIRQPVGREAAAAEQTTRCPEYTAEAHIMLISYGFRFEFAEEAERQQLTRDSKDSAVFGLVVRMQISGEETRRGKTLNFPLSE